MVMNMDESQIRMIEKIVQFLHVVPKSCLLRTVAKQCVSKRISGDTIESLIAAEPRISSLSTAD